LGGSPDPDRLRTRLAPLAPAFNLLGEGPLFLQDLEWLEGEANPPDMLFIDSAGANTARNNADLMVHRERYPALEAGLAAMALYAFQAHAPSGGAGSRTSMRGGGPLVTLVDPGQGLWPLIWANVPEGMPQAVACLPWMAPTRLSDKGAQVVPPQGATFGPEAFFGMPRRLRLIAAGDLVTGWCKSPGARIMRAGCTRSRRITGSRRARNGCRFIRGPGGSANRGARGLPPVGPAREDHPAHRGGAVGGRSAPARPAARGAWPRV
jgi:CRISPR type I-E-associated protein CasA/Cse1